MELRRDMWQMVRRLRESGVTIILTTHYIEEAEEMADRIGVISKGELIVVEEKTALMRKLGKKQLTLQLQAPLGDDPRGARRPAARAREGWQRAHLQLRHPGERNRHRRRCCASLSELRDRIQGPAHGRELARRDLREPREVAAMNLHAVRAIYQFEMARTWRTLLQSIATPVMTTSLYFVVFGSAIGSRMMSIDGVSYGAFIVPGLIMLTVLMESVSNASFGIYMPKFAGTIYELLSAPVGLAETCRLRGRRRHQVGDPGHRHPHHRAAVRAVRDRCTPCGWSGFLMLTSVTFSLFGFVIGIWADSWEKIQIVPMMVVTPLTFLGGSFYSISMLPPRVAEDHAVQPGGVSRERLSLELLRRVGRQRRVELRHDARIHGAVPGHHLLDVPHRVQAEELTCAVGGAAAVPQRAHPRKDEFAFAGPFGMG